MGKESREGSPTSARLVFMRTSSFSLERLIRVRDNPEQLACVRRVSSLSAADQGIFVHRTLFEEVGGYKELPLMEDYQLVGHACMGGHRCPFF